MRLNIVALSIRYALGMDRFAIPWPIATHSALLQPYIKTIATPPGFGVAQINTRRKEHHEQHRARARSV